MIAARIPPPQVSPCISLESFEVGEEVAGRFPPERVARGRPGWGPNPHADIAGLLLDQLRAAGLKVFVRENFCVGARGAFHCGRDPELLARLRSFPSSPQAGAFAAAGECTVIGAKRDPPRFFSHRADAGSALPNGRMLAFIGLALSPSGNNEVL